MFTVCRRTALVLLTLLVAACSNIQDHPTETYDGLVLLPETGFSQVYERPGADLSGYEAFGLEPCQVAFRKNWLRSQNTNRMDLGSRVTQKDVDNIKDQLSELCFRKFAEVLQQPPPYQLVANFDGGEPVLILRPAIINLDINAPDKKTSSMSRTYTTSAGEMTLLLELLDGTTGQILYRIVDRRRSAETHYLQWSDSVTNQAEANRWLKRWATQLREGLDEVRASSGNGTQ